MRGVLIILGAVILTFALLFSSSLTASKEDGPRIDVPKTTWDFGKIPESSVVSHAYLIKNIGADTLKITEVHTSCGCTKAPLDKKELGPGDSTKVELIYSAGGHEGKVGKSANITSNDTTISSVGISFSGELVANFDSTNPITISPSKVEFGKSGKQNGNQGKLKIRNVSQREVKVAVLDYPQDLIKISPSQMKIKSGGEQELKVKLKKELKEVEFKKSITLEAEGENKSRFSIPLLK